MAPPTVLPEVVAHDAAAVVVDENLRVVQWSPGAAWLTGVPESDALGAPCWKLLGGLSLAGEPVCASGCPLAVHVFASEPDGQRTLLVGEREHRTAATMDTVVLALPDERFLLHLIRPVAGPPQQRADAPPSLTTRQREIVVLLARGLSTQDICGELVLAEATVRNHVRGALRALGCHSRVEAVARARELRLV